ncbi:MAG: hypothetical protein HYS41_04790 [Candidatus Omnitrophica bacterium]|nr:hypothetical protein [Candidatus Omnitrophota bacterium]
MAKKRPKAESAFRRTPERPEGSACWLFPSTDHGEDDGFSDSQLEYFQGDHERHVARETIQNSVDQRLDYRRPVSVVFERFAMPVSALPGHASLLDTMRRCREFVAGQDKAERFFDSAAKFLTGTRLPVLKISDSNTCGLSGSDMDKEGNWYRLVRAAGTSSPKGVAGGSFGIGKGAPIAASALRTVFYSSINEAGEPVFQGKSRLVSHYDGGGDVRQGVGFYGTDGHRAIRNAALIPSIFGRKERGTDIFIISYAIEGNWLEKLIKPILYNFWLAIHHGDLEVTIRDGREKTISKATLAKDLAEHDCGNARFFFEAVTNPTQTFEKDLQYFGNASLFVRKHPDYPSEVMMVRKPRMLVRERPFRALREPYASVLVCDDDRGNDLLRELEPPAHDKWDKARHPDGEAALRELDHFIRSSLKSMGEAVSGELQDIPGLDRYLPDSDDRDPAFPGGPDAFEPSELATSEETGREVGAAGEPAEGSVDGVPRRAVVVTSPAGGGRHRKGKKRLRPSPTPPPGEEKGEGKRIRTSDIRFRSFVQRDGGGIEYRVLITGREPCEGDMHLVAVGDDGSYAADVESAVDADTRAPYPVSGPAIRGLAVGKGETIKLIVRLASNKKYALGIEAYEG